MIAKVRNQTLDSFAGLGVVTHDTMEEYEALSEEEKMDGNIHLVLEEEPINANIVEYTDGKTVKDELDDIAEKTGNTDISAIGDGTTTGAISQINEHLNDIGTRVHNEGYTAYTVTSGGVINQITIPKNGTYLFTAYIRGGICWYTKNGAAFPDPTGHVATADTASYAAVWTLEEGDIIAQANYSGTTITYTASEMSAVRLK